MLFDSSWASLVLVSYRGVLDDPRPRLRGWLHKWAFFVSVPAGVVVVALAQGASARAGAAVYAVSLSGLFGTSAAYHRLARSVRARAVLRRADHAMIYVLIAGTSTPVALHVLDGAAAVVGLSLMWAGALLGVALKLSPHSYGVAASAGYIVLGWLAMLALPQLVTGLGAALFVLLVAGGVLDTAGAVILLRRWPDPAPSVFGYHEVWHAFVVGAGLCHYAMIVALVRVG